MFFVSVSVHVKRIDTIRSDSTERKGEKEEEKSFLLNFFPQAAKKMKESHFFLSFSGESFLFSSPCKRWPLISSVLRMQKVLTFFSVQLSYNLGKYLLTYPVWWMHYDNHHVVLMYHLSNAKAGTIFDKTKAGRSILWPYTGGKFFATPSLSWRLSLGKFHTVAVAVPL